MPRKHSHPARRVIAGLAFVGLLGFFSWLLWESKIGELAYSGLISASGALAIAVAEVDRIVELRAGKLHFKLEKAIEAVYAREEDLRGAAKVMCELIVFNMSWQGRLHGRGQYTHFQRHPRDLVRELLARLAVSAEEIDRICSSDAFQIFPEEPG